MTMVMGMTEVVIIMVVIMKLVRQWWLMCF